MGLSSWWRAEISRKVLHLSAAIIPLAYMGLDRRTTLWVLGGCLALAVAVETLRHVSPGFRDLFRRAVGFMPDFFGVYDRMTAQEYLEFFAAAYDVPVKRRAGLIGDLLALVELSHKCDADAGSLLERVAVPQTGGHCGFADSQRV